MPVALAAETEDHRIDCFHCIDGLARHAVRQGASLSAADRIILQEAGGDFFGCDCDAVLSKPGAGYQDKRLDERLRIPSLLISNTLTLITIIISDTAFGHGR